MAGHLLFSLSSYHSVHPLWPLHHVQRHWEAAGETPGKESPNPSAPALGVTAPGLPGLPHRVWGAIHTALQPLTGSSPIPSSWKTWMSS